MPSLTRAMFERLTAPGSRLPWLREWLLGQVWNPDRYFSFGPIPYLEQGEKMVNEVEEVLTAAAPRVYDELSTGLPANRNIGTFLHQTRPGAAVVFDGLSLREVPLILRLAEESGRNVREIDIGTAAVPSETTEYVRQRLDLPPISPSQLPGRRELKDRGIETYYFDNEGRRHALNEEAQVLLLWSAFPDQTYQDSGARFPNHFAELHRRLQAVWRNTVQAVPRARPILITSDHGYVYFGAGCSAPRSNQALRPLREWFGGERWRSLPTGEVCPTHSDIAHLPHRNLTIIKGRVQTHPPGPGGTRLYKHGGLSLMEMLVPWIILEP